MKTNKDHYTQLRIRRSTLKKLHRIYGQNSEKLIDLIDRLATQELEKITSETSE